MGSGSSVQCKIRHCTECYGDTEFYCNTCQHDLCLSCKEGHVIDLDTIHHDVVIYREKYDIQKHETCLRHPDRMYTNYCYTCKLPVCAKCKEHEQHKILDIRTAYKTHREQYRDILQKIRGEALYKTRFFLAIIKTDTKTAQTKIIKYHLKMSKKGKELKNFIATVMLNVQVLFYNFMTHKLQQKRKLLRNLGSIEKYEHKYEQSVNRAIKFLLFYKIIFVPKIKDTLQLTQHTLPSLREEIKIEDVIEFLSEVQIIGRRQRQMRDEDLLELMSTPVLVKTIQLKHFGYVTHISCLHSNMFWISLSHNNSTYLFLKNIARDFLHHLTKITYSTSNAIYETHTVNNKGELIYIGPNNEMFKLSKDNRTGSTLIEGTVEWKPRCVYSSLINGDLLIIQIWMFCLNRYRIDRYNSTGQHIHTIRDTKGQKLHSNPTCIVENCNGDVIVSDIDWLGGAVVVTDRVGRHRFSYTGHQSGLRLQPRGICTNALSHILVCDLETVTIQIIDKDGNFLLSILTQEQGKIPRTLSYDNKTHLLLVGFRDNNELCVYRYIKRQTCYIGKCDSLIT